MTRILPLSRRAHSLLSAMRGGSFAVHYMPKLGLHKSYFLRDDERIRCTREADELIRAGLVTIQNGFLHLTEGKEQMATNEANVRELLPCPFCGESARFGQVPNERDSEEAGGEFICCTGCGASTNLRWSLKEDARPLLAAAWNKRATQPPPTAAKGDTRLEEIACDLPALMGRASLEGHEVGQRLALEVQAKMRAALSATQPNPEASTPTSARGDCVLVPRALLESAVCPMKADGCDGEQYPVGDPLGHYYGEQCQWCYERRQALALPEADELCPNCVTPWKCNGPHEPAAATPVVAHGEAAEVTDAECHRAMKSLFPYGYNAEIWTDYVRRTLAQFAKSRALASQPAEGQKAVTEVCGAPKDGRPCYPECDCETERDCMYGTQPAGFYLASFKHGRDGVVCWWRPDNAGYTNDLAQAGVYHDLKPGYHDSEDTVPVPVSFIERLRVRQVIDYGDSLNGAFHSAKSLRAALNQPARDEEAP